MRLVFTGLAALGVLAAITFWWAPKQPEVPQLVLVPPSETPPEPTGVAPTPEPAVSARAPEPDASPAPLPAPAEPKPPAVGEPILEEEELLVVERPDFSEEGPPAELEADEEASEIRESEPAPTPVDVEQSGDLIRRMLALYEAMRE